MVGSLFQPPNKEKESETLIWTKDRKKKKKKHRHVDCAFSLVEPKTARFIHSRGTHSLKKQKREKSVGKHIPLSASAKVPPSVAILYASVTGTPVARYDTQYNLAQSSSATHSTAQRREETYY
jgi:hypothetical protein